MHQWYFHGRHWSLGQDPSHVLLHSPPSPSQHLHTTPSVLNTFEYPANKPKHIPWSELWLRERERGRKRETGLLWNDAGLASMALGYWKMATTMKNKAKSSSLLSGIISRPFWETKRVKIVYVGSTKATWRRFVINKMQLGLCDKRYKQRWRMCGF